MKNIINGIYKYFLIFMLLLWIFISWSSIFNIYPTMGNDIELSSLVIMLGVSLVLLFLVFIYRKIILYSEKMHNKIAFFLCIFSFIILCVWGLTHKVLFTYDLNHIVDEVYVLLNNKNHIVGDSYYFSLYPNQIPLFILIYFISFLGSLLGIQPGVSMIVYNCFMIALSFLFMYKILKEIFNSKIALIGLILMMLIPDFYLYSSYYYTDIISIPFSIIGFYLIIKSDKEEGKLSLVFRILGGVLFAIGFKIRVVTVFLLLSYFIIIIFKDKFITNLKRLIPIAVAFVCILLLYSNVAEPYFKININNSYTLPATHWIMMGSNTANDGSYSDDDVRYSVNAENKIDANLSKLKERSKKIDLKFINNKIRRVWSQGDHDVTRKYTNIEKVDSLYKLIIGRGSIFVKYLEQITKVTVYILFLIALANDLFLKQSITKSKTSVIFVSIFGAFLFYLFWEALSRYSFSFMPWIIIAGAYSVTLIDNALKINTISFDHKKIYIYPFRKMLGILLIVFMFLTLFLGFLNYSVKKRNINFIRYSQYSTNDNVHIVNNEIKQVFRVDKDFNTIELVFNKDKLNKEIDYEFELYDNDDNLIYTKTFDTTWATKNKYTKFKFPRQKVKGSQEYYFKIYSSDSSENNYLNVGVSTIDNCKNKNIYEKNLGYDVNPNGETYSDDKLLCSELRYKIIDNKKGNIISKKVFIMISLVIFIITLYCSYTLLINNNRRIKRVRVNKEWL